MINDVYGILIEKNSVYTPIDLGVKDIQYDKKGREKLIADKKNLLRNLKV